MTEQAKKRPEFRNINFFKDLPTYRLPPAGIVSILHRISGLLMFILLPFILWMMDMSLTSEISFDGFASVFAGPFGWFLKLVCLALIWAYLHHFCAGVRHLFMDVNRSEEHTSELQSPCNLVCRLLLEKKKQIS